MRLNVKAILRKAIKGEDFEALADKWIRWDRSPVGRMAAKRDREEAALDREIAEGFASWDC